MHVDEKNQGGQAEWLFSPEKAVQAYSKKGAVTAEEDMNVCSVSIQREG